MKTHYEYIHFEKVAETPKTSSWICRSNRSNDDLGMVKWYSPWRQYCFSAGYSVYNIECLKDIIDFIQQLMNERKLEAHSG